MHDDAYDAVARMRPGDHLVKRVYEIGSLDINGSVRPLFWDAIQYHGIDAAEGPGVDVVADGATYTPPFRPDCVVCCEVLEHAADPEAVVRQMANVVEPGGYVIVTCASLGRAPHSAVDGGRLQKDEHYANVSAFELRSWMEAAGLRDVIVDTGLGVSGARLANSDEPGDVYAVGVKP